MLQRRREEAAPVGAHGFDHFAPPLHQPVDRQLLVHRRRFRIRARGSSESIGCGGRIALQLRRRSRVARRLRRDHPGCPRARILRRLLEHHRRAGVRGGRCAASRSGCTRSAAARRRCARRLSTAEDAPRVATHSTSGAAAASFAALLIVAGTSRRVAHAAQHFLQRERPVHEREANQQRLQQDLLLRALAETRLELGDGVQHPQQVARAEPSHDRRECFARMIREIRCIAAEYQRELAAQEIRQPREEAAEIGAGIREPRDCREHFRCASRCDVFQDVQILIFRNEAERIAHALSGERPLAERQHLIGEAERIAHRAVRGARQECERVVLPLHLLAVEHHGEPRAHVGRTYSAEVEALQPAEHGRGHLRDFLWLRGGEHEHHARRRLLEDLQKRVPRFAREHVRLVHDVDLVARFARGCVHRALAQLPRVIHSSVRRGVDLDHVETRGSAPDPLARRAHSARFASACGVSISSSTGDAPLAVERHGEHARERSLPDATRSA